MQAKHHMTKLINCLYEEVKFKSHRSKKNSEVFHDKRM